MKHKTRKIRKTPRKELTNDTVALYRAAQRYIESRGGNFLLASGVQIIQWPGYSPMKFTLGIKCLGYKPHKTEKA